MAVLVRDLIRYFPTLIKMEAASYDFGVVMISALPAVSRLLSYLPKGIRKCGHI
jgi:hypothetical protein